MNRCFSSEPLRCLPERTVVAALLSATALFVVSPAAAQTSLTLDDAMTRARAQTADARQNTAAIGEAEARVKQARAGFYPRIDLSETIQRGDNPVFVFSSLLSQRRFAADNFAIPVLNDPNPITNTRTAIVVEQSVFNSGLTRLGVEAATLGRDLAVTSRDSVAQDLAFRAAEAFVRVLQQESTLRAAEAAVAAAESDQQRARARREVGLATEADALAVDVHLADMRQRRIAADADLAVSRMQLADAVGLPLTSAITPLRPTPNVTSDDAEALLRAAMATHPKRLGANLRLQLARNGRRTARAALLPSVALQGAWEFNGATLDAQQSSWVIGAEVRMNLFKGFADSARDAEAAQSEVRATADREGIERRIELDVRAALAQLAAARAREQTGRTALAQARESQRIIRDRYDSGLATITDVLRAAAATLDAESRATAAEMDVILQSVALDRALGRL